MLRSFQNDSALTLNIFLSFLGLVKELEACEIGGFLLIYANGYMHDWCYCVLIFLILPVKFENMRQLNSTDVMSILLFISVVINKLNLPDK